MRQPEPRLHLNEMTRDEIRAIAAETTVIIPVAATEQHGPHLPMLVDSFVITNLAEQAAEQAAVHVPVTVIPTLPFGSSHHHQVYGALSLSGDTFSRVLMDLGISLVRMGFRRLFFLNGHGGNDDLIRQAARDLALTYPIRVGAASYWTLAADALAEANAAAVGSTPGHAGGFETSVMLALWPEMVRTDRYPVDGGFPTGSKGRGGLFVQQHGIWEVSGGYSEPPVRASAEAGQQFVAAVVDAVAASVVSFHQEGTGEEL
jgi:creatinine amidohydrolase